jgi:ribosomal protein S18 acetylase RimI-like enzyme
MTPEGAAGIVEVGEGLRLRPTQQNDRDFLRWVYGSTRMEELAQTDWSDEQKAAFIQQQFDAQDTHYRQHYAPEAEYFVIEDGERPIGRFYIARWTSEIRIMDIALLPEERGRGLGGRLLAAILAEGEAHGKRVSVHVEMYNPALKLYQRLGFRALSEYGMYFLMEWQPQGAAEERHESDPAG